MEKTVKYRLYPNRKQMQLMNQTFGCKRFVFNYFLDLSIDEYKQSGKTLNYYDYARQLTELKKQSGFEWLKDVDSTALQNSVKDLWSAYQNFFKKQSGFPCFKSKHDRRQSYRSTCVGTNIKVLDKVIQLPKLGLVKARISRCIQGRILSATVSRNPAGKYFVAITYTDVIIPALKKTNENVGIDLGLHDVVIRSDGHKYTNPKYLKQSERKMRRLQRAFSRKQKGSANWERNRLQIARLYEYITNQRLDNLHKITTDLVRCYDVICMEDLAVRNMVRNRRLSKHISDASLGELRRQLEYKALWYGKTVIHVSRFFPSSKRCSVCFDVHDITNDLSVRAWICPTCRTKHDRDVNAACNILIEGMRLMHVSIG